LGGYVYIYSEGTCTSHLADASAYVIFCSRAHVNEEEFGIQAHRFVVCSVAEPNAHVDKEELAIQCFVACSVAVLWLARLWHAL